ncbi:hypothetical protein [Paludibacter sp. 221]|uniref:hypothetical protein n=1 Tax=Paludibacter sp. 221 TaxID=2302939 RepID=UPI001EF2E737|nr:hypothetical protein [Paludibacter sp. 221]
MEAKKITIKSIIPEGISIGIKNVLSLIGAVVLYILTCWIPYINVGTTIAMAAIPIELAKGKVISPTFIFDGKYRKYMGEYFSLIGLMSIAIVPAMAFMIVPGIIISLSWSLAVYVLIDKGIAPSEAMIQSNKATYGYKWTIFGTGILLGLAFGILSFVLGMIPFVGIVFVIILAIVFVVTMLGCNTVIYKKLVLEANNDNEPEQEVIITETITPEGEEIKVEIIEDEKKDEE